MTRSQAPHESRGCGRGCHPQRNAKAAQGQDQVRTQQREADAEADPGQPVKDVIREAKVMGRVSRDPLQLAAHVLQQGGSHRPWVNGMSLPVKAGPQRPKLLWLCVRGVGSDRLRGILRNADPPDAGPDVVVRDPQNAMARTCDAQEADCPLAGLWCQSNRGQP